MRKLIELLADEELDRANAKFPKFSSRHEGYAVMLEEVAEADDELTGLKELMNMFWHFQIRKDTTRANEKEQINEVYDFAIKLASEAIQIAAMALKYQNMEGIR